jgi:hypothetical protein
MAPSKRDSSSIGASGPAAKCTKVLAGLGPCTGGAKVLVIKKYHNMTSLSCVKVSQKFLHTYEYLMHRNYDLTSAMPFNVKTTSDHINIMKRPNVMDESPDKRCNVGTKSPTDLAEVVCIMRALQAKDYAFNKVLRAGFDRLLRSSRDPSPASGAWFMTSDPSVHKAAELLGQTIISHEEQHYSMCVQPAITASGTAHPFIYEVLSAGQQLAGLAYGVGASINYVPAYALDDALLEHLNSDNKVWSIVDRNHLFKHAGAISEFGAAVYGIWSEQAEFIVETAVRSCFRAGPITDNAVLPTMQQEKAPQDVQEVFESVWAGYCDGTPCSGFNVGNLPVGDSHRKLPVAPVVKRATLSERRRLGHRGIQEESFITDTDGEETGSACDEDDFSGGSETEASEEYKSESDSDGDFVSDDSE